MKHYFLDEDSEIFDLDQIKDLMKDEGITEKTVFKAVPSIGSRFFYCKAVFEVGETGNCGKDCEGYKPKNGKNGCCKFWGFCYEPGEEILIKI